MEAEKRKLIKFSNYSLCVTLPKWVVRDLKWKKGDLVYMEVDAENGKIIVSGKKPKNHLEDIRTEKPEHKLRW